MWQPIKTAPKMTAIILYAAGYYIGHFNTTNNKWWSSGHGTDTATDRHLNSPGNLTHWMPLPEAPEKHSPPQDDKWDDPTIIPH